MHPRSLSLILLSLLPLYSEDRVRNGIHRLEKMLGAKQQGRLDGFFKPMGTVSSKTGSSKTAAADSKGKNGKRKVSLLESTTFIFNIRVSLMQRWLSQADDKEKPGAKKVKGKK